MKKVLVALCIVLLVSIAGGYFYGKITPRIVPTTAQQTPSPKPEKGVLSETIVAHPAVLRIPKLSIEAAVESVGQDSRGNMDVPKMAQNVGWYNLGAMPGEQGNAVMAGHLDTVTGAPAVFYDLAKLQLGDGLTVEDEHGNEYRFTVTEKRTYPTDEFPLQEVFGTTEKFRLNLITCSGSFDSTAKNYSHRTVIYSELVE
jgi:LPXTG-site transpeptidase (sortase) family protein